MSYRTVVVDGKCKPFIKPVKKICTPTEVPELQASTENVLIRSGKEKRVVVRYKYPFSEPGVLVARLDSSRTLTREEDDKVIIETTSADNSGFSILILNMNAFDVEYVLQWQASAATPVVPDLQADVKNFSIKGGETKRVVVCYKYPFTEPGHLVANLWTNDTTPEQDEKVLVETDIINNDGFSLIVTNKNKARINCSLNYQAAR